MIILLGEWGNVGITEIEVLSIYCCSCSRTCTELQARSLFIGVEAFCSNVALQMQAITKCQEAHFRNLFVLSGQVSVGTGCRV